MALTPARPAARLGRQALRNCKSQSAMPSFRPIITSSPFSSSTSRPQEAAAVEEIPRYARTPPRMKATFSPHIFNVKDPQNTIWKVNENPQKLDNALNTFLGRGGEKLLPDELKWLAVTHKSYDQGRRGFNDRLAFLGRQICVVESMQRVVTSPASDQQGIRDVFEDRRQPFEDPALNMADNLSTTHPADVLSPDVLQKLAVETGLTEVVRWKPRRTQHLKSSGMKGVMTGAIFALIGAISLQHGAKVASRIVRERVLKKIRL